MLKLSKNYPSKRAFITGGGSGLGREFALRLAKDGWTIAITDLKTELVDTVAKEITDLGGQPQTYVFDVSNSEDFKSASEQFLQENGGIDLVINNAGVSDGGAFHTVSLERWDWMVGINQMGVVYGCHYFFPEMRQAKSGQIINIASAAGFAYIPSFSTYNVTKAAVNALSECLYYEAKPMNVRISVVMPTFFKTNIAQAWRGSESSKKAAQRYLEKSNLEADVVANEILTRAGDGEFRIILPKTARRLHRMIRFFPRMYQRMTLKNEEKRKARAAARKKAGEG